MKERTQSLIFLVVLGVVGYFAYQYFGIPWLEGKNSARPTLNIYSLPEKCQGAGESLKKAISDGRPTTSINGFAKNFRECLRLEGLTKSEIDEAVYMIKNSR